MENVSIFVGVEIFGIYKLRLGYYDKWISMELKEFKNVSVKFVK